MGKLGDGVGRQPHLFVALLSIILLFAMTSAEAHAEDTSQGAWSGDATTQPLSIASDLSPRLRREDVRNAILKVAAWELNRSSARFNQDWTFAALYTGLMAVPLAADGQTYQNAMLQMGGKFEWQPGPRLVHADDQAVSKTYLDLYLRDHDPAMMAPTRARANAVMQLRDDPKQPLWWWCDALFMAPPIFVKLSRATGDRAYLDYMDHHWWITSNLLYSHKDHLFFRDNSYLNAHELNGRSLFWSRGNGWVFAALAEVLEEMPQSYHTRSLYVAQFRDMARSIAALQGDDGLWRPGLLDAAAYPYPETSGSAFFAYGFAWGINHGLLDRRTYLPVVKKAWHGLLAHVYEDGRLGCVQPVGAAPGSYTPTSSYVYGTGAFLLAGSEIYKLSH